MKCYVEYNCKNCNVKPEFKTVFIGFEDSCYFECPKCGCRTENCSMPWIAIEKWNKKEFIDYQIKLI